MLFIDVSGFVNPSSFVVNSRMKDWFFFFEIGLRGTMLLCACAPMRQTRGWQSRTKHLVNARASNRRRRGKTRESSNDILPDCISNMTFYVVWKSVIVLNYWKDDRREKESRITGKSMAQPPISPIKSFLSISFLFLKYERLNRHRSAWRFFSLLF